MGFAGLLRTLSRRRGEGGEPKALADLEHLFHGLAALGHEVNWSGNRIAFGRGQIIWRDAQGVLCGGTEPRTDGAIAAW